MSQHTFPIVCSQLQGLLDSIHLWKFRILWHCNGIISEAAKNDAKNDIMLWAMNRIVFSQVDLGMLNHNT